MTRDAREAWAAKLCAEAFQVDAQHAEEICRAVTGGFEVVSFQALTKGQLIAFTRAMFRIARLT